MHTIFTEKIHKTLKEMEMQNKFGELGVIEANVKGNHCGNIYVERYLDLKGNAKFKFFRKLRSLEKQVNQKIA